MTRTLIQFTNASLSSPTTLRARSTPTGTYFNADLAREPRKKKPSSGGLTEEHLQVNNKSRGSEEEILETLKKQTPPTLS